MERLAMGSLPQNSGTLAHALPALHEMLASKLLSPIRLRAADLALGVGDPSLSVVNVGEDVVP